MHTMARVKNLALADGDDPEPPGREIGEQQVVEAADRLVANTARRGRPARRAVRRRPGRVAVVPPGVDLDVFRPADRRSRGRAAPRSGIAAGRRVLLFVGRIQPLKAPDVLLRAAAELLARRPELRAPAGRRRRRRPERHRAARRRRRCSRLAARARHRRLRALRAAGRRATSWPTGTARPTWSSSRRTASRSGWSRSRPRPAATPVRRRRRRRAARRRARRASAACWSPGHDPAHWADAARRLLLDDARRARRWRAGAVGTRPGSAGTPRSTRCWTVYAAATSTFAAVAAGAGSVGAVTHASEVEQLVARPPGRGRDRARARRPARRVRRDAARRAQAAHHGVAARRRPLAVGVGVRVRHPDENHEEFYRWLLRAQRPAARDRVRHRRRRRRLPGRPAAAGGGRRRRRWTGCSARSWRPSDSSFNPLLTSASSSSMQREWAWRVSRGESTRNLRGVPPPAGHRAAERRSLGSRGMSDAPYTLVLLRHGESEWNAANLFTGWVDVALSEQGRGRGRAAAASCSRERGLLPDVAAHLAAAPGDHDREHRPATPPTGTGSRCGAPGGSTSGTTARCRARTRADPRGVRRGAVHALAPLVRRPAAAAGRRQRVLPGRRPALRRPRRRRPARAPSAWPTSSAGCCPTGTTRSCPTCAAGKTVLVAAHGNRLRALVKHLDGISDDEIAGLNIPTGIPLRLRPRRRPAPDRARRRVPRPGRRGRAPIEAVANQGR